MGTALLGAAVVVLAQLLNIVPAGEAIALTGTKLAIGVSVNFMLGALMTLGVGLYAPCMVLISVLGMNPTAAFPIMMGSCAFLMPIASMQFIRRDAYNVRAAVGLALGGPLAVLLAVLADYGAANVFGARPRADRDSLHVDHDAPLRSGGEKGRQEWPPLAQPALARRSRHSVRRSSAGDAFMAGVSVSATASVTAAMTAAPARRSAAETPDASATPIITTA